jgi:SAM-dependent methyltransferase
MGDGRLLTHEEMVGLQAERHDLVATSGFASTHEYVLHLVHAKAYHEAARLAEGRRVLDLGCNTGYGTEILARSARAAVGVDVSARAVAAARAARPGIPFHAIDGSRLPFEEGAFELVVSCQVLEHVVDVAGFVRELKRVLVPGGLAVFTTPNAAIRLDPGMPPWNPFHVRELTARELGPLLGGSFAAVCVLGLLADEPVASIERGRAAGARRIARRAAALRRSRARRLGAAALSAALGVAARARRALGLARPPPPAGVDPAFARAHGLGDLWYAEDPPDDALDLLALCSDDAAALGVARRALAQAGRRSSNQ